MVSLLDFDHVMEERFVAFLDILGFKDLINSIEENGKGSCETLKAVKSILNFMDEETYEPNYGSDLPIYKNINGQIFELELGDPRLTYVSDCVVISAEPTLDGFKALSNKIHKITSDLAVDGFFCRGAISKGKLFHKGRILFGSAYVRAYQLEEGEAKYPRVIIDPNILDFFDLSDGKMPLAPIFFGKDLDGFYYQRYWVWQKFPPYVGNFGTYINIVERHIKKFKLRFEGKPNLLEKYDWLDVELKNLMEFWKILSCDDQSTTSEGEV